MNRICIVFPGGSYGTFLDWCLNYFSKPDTDQTMPFRTTGSSHNFDGNHITVSDLASYGTEHKLNTARLHPKTNAEDDIFEVLEYVKGYFEKVIYLHPTVDSMAWTINNKFEKVWDEGWVKHYEAQFQDNLKSWNKNSIDGMETWEQREFLSMYIYQQHLIENEVENLEPIKSQFPDFLFVDITDLRDQFRATLGQVFAYWGHELVNIDQIDSVFRTWIDLQRHCHKDKAIKHIADSVCNDQACDWSADKLTLADEALLQMQLRNRGLELRCFDLNQFPTSTDKLRPYLYVA